MEEVSNGGLHFTTELDINKVKDAIDETTLRIQGLSDGTVSSGVSEADVAFLGVAEQIEQGFRDIGTGIDINSQRVEELEAKYKSLGESAAKASAAGNDKKYNAATQQQNVVQGEIATRKILIRELKQQEEALNKLEKSYQKVQNQAKANAMSSDSLQAAIQQVKNEMVALIDVNGSGEIFAGQEARYDVLKQKLGQLMKLQGDIQAQGKAFASDMPNFGGIISGLSGVVSGLSAASAEISLFTDENEDLQRIMKKVQSVMTMTIELQKVADTLNKNSAFRQVTINGLKEWWAKVTGKAAVASVAETAATKINTAAQAENTITKGANTAVTEGQTIVAKKGILANLGLAGAFRTLSAAIKSIPVFGWIAAGITALIAVYAIFTNKARKAKKAQEEFAKSVADNAYKPIGAIDELSIKYEKLGNDMAAKEKFLEENRKAFDELGVSIKNVADMENLLITNKDAFIASQIAKAKAVVYRQRGEEDIKKLIKMEEKYNAMPDKVERNIYESTPAGRGVVGTTLVPNGKKNMLGEEIKKYKDEIKKKYELAIGAEEEGAKALEDAKIKILSDTDKTNKDKTDPVIAKIEARKKAYTEYYKWVNKGLGKEAEEAFADTLKGGSTYLEYLNKMKDKTSLTQKQLKYILNEIASETDQSVIDTFKTSLDEQLEAENDVLAKLAIIADKRSELKGDNTQLGKEKSEAVDNAENGIMKQVRKEYNEAQAEYNKYIQSKIDGEIRYLEERAKLQKQYDEATTPEQKEAAKIKLDTLDTNDKTNSQKKYDEMLKEYASFEKRKQEIIDKYAAKRKVAEANGNTDMAKEIDRSEGKELSKLASDELTQSDAWTNLFGNLDELTARQIDVLVKEIEAKFDTLSGTFNPIDLSNILKKLNEAKTVIMQDNPFRQVGEAIKTIFDNAGKNSADTAQNIKRNWKQLGQATSNSFAFVQDAIGSAEFLKDAIGDIGATAISSLSTVATMAVAVAAAIDTAESSSVILTIIKAALLVVQAVLNVIKSIAGNRDKEIEKTVKAHKEAVDRLQQSYDNLSRAVDKALGEEKYKKQKEMIDNLKKQREHLKAAWEAEQNKKKSDPEKVKELKKQYEQAGREIEDNISKILDNILQTDAKSIANELGEAFISAFSKGENAAVAFGKKVDDIVANIVRRMLIQKLLEQPIGKIIDRYSKRWIDGDGNFNGFDKVIEDMGAFGDDLKAIGEGFGKALEGMPEDIKKFFTGGEASSTAMSGAIKGVSEETASLVAGQMNAIRVNQLENAQVLQQQLVQVTNIARNTAIISEYATYNRYLKSIYERLSANEVNTVRGRGLLN